MSPAEALQIVRTVCDAHLCNAQNRHTIDDALETLRARVYLAETVDDTPPPGNGKSTRKREPAP